MIGQRVSYGRARKLYRQQPSVQTSVQAPPPPPPPSPPPAPPALAPVVRESRPELTPEDVRRFVLRHYGLSVDALQGRLRTPALMDARGMIVHVCRLMTDASYPQITRVVRGPDVLHTSMLTAHNRMRRELLAREDLRQTLRTLIMTIDLATPGWIKRTRPGQGEGYAIEGEPVEGGAA